MMNLKSGPQQFENVATKTYGSGWGIREPFNVMHVLMWEQLDTKNLLHKGNT